MNECSGGKQYITRIFKNFSQASNFVWLKIYIFKIKIRDLKVLLVNLHKFSTHLLAKLKAKKNVLY